MRHPLLRHHLALALLSVASWLGAARAEHGGPSLTIAPQAEALLCGEQIALISANGCDDRIDPEFLKGAAPELVSGEARIPLKLVHHFCDGDGYGRGVAILAPLKPLLPNKEHHLMLLEAPPWGAPKAPRQRVTLGRWRAAPCAARPAPPEWLGAPYLGAPRDELPTLVAPVRAAGRPLHILIEATPLGGGPARALTASVLKREHPYQAVEPGCGLLYVVGKPSEITRPFDLTFTALNHMGDAIKAPGPALRFTALVGQTPSLITEDLGALLLNVCVGAPKGSTWP